MPADVNLNIDITSKGSGGEEAAAGLEAVAKSADNAKDQLSQLDRKLLETRAAMVAAGKTFTETGDISPLKALLKDERQLSTVQKSISRGAEAIAKDLAKVNTGLGGNAQGGLLNFAIDEWVAKLARGTKQGVQSGVDQISGTAPTGLIQWLVAGAVAASPAIGAAINTAVLLGAGGVGLAGGIALAAQSPIVRSSYADLGHYVHDQLTLAASNLEGPVAQSAGIMRGAFNQVLPGIKSDFDSLAPSVEHLTSGLASFVVNVMPGFNHSIEASVPLLNKLGDDTLPRMGSAIGYFFDRMAEGEPGAEMFLHDFTTGLDLTLKYVGNITLALDQMYKAYRDPTGDLQTHGLTGVLGPLLDKLDLLDGKAKKTTASMDPLADALKRIPQAASSAGLGVQLAANDFSNLSAAISKTETTSDMLAGQMVDKVLNATLALDRGALGAAEAQTQLADSFKQNTVSARNHAVQLDITTAAGQANRSAILGVVSANIAEYDAMIRSGASAQSAAADYNTNTGALVRQMRQAGLTQAQIDGLIGKYKGVPTNVDTTIATNGLTAAINGLSDLIKQINNIPTYKSITVDTNYTRSGEYNSQVPAAARATSSSGSGNAPRARAYGGIDVHAASGLLGDAAVYSAVASGARYAFAEPRTGGEAFIPRSGISDARGLAIANVAAGWHGGRVVPDSGGYGMPGGYGGLGAARSGAPVTVNVYAGMGTDGQQVGKQVVAAIKQYEQTNGTTWRS